MAYSWVTGGVTPRLCAEVDVVGSAAGEGHVAEGCDGSAVLLLTIDQAAAALAVPRSWLRDKVTARQVPHTRLGRHVRFTVEHLRQIIELGEENAVSGPVPTGGLRRRRESRRAAVPGGLPAQGRAEGRHGQSA